MKFTSSIVALATLASVALGLVITDDPEQLEYLETPETNHIFLAYAKIIPSLAAANIVTNAGALALKMGMKVPFVNSKDLSRAPTHEELIAGLRMVIQYSSETGRPWSKAVNPTLPMAALKWVVGKSSNKPFTAEDLKLARRTVFNMYMAQTIAKNAETSKNAHIVLPDPIQTVTVTIGAAPTN